MKSPLERRSLLPAMLLLAGMLTYWKTTPLQADIFEWANPVSGNFDTAGNWNNTTGGDLPPPNAGDDVEFNELGSYQITFTQDEASDSLRGFAGDVTFASNNSTLRTFTIATGSADANISGGSIQVGTNANPVFLNLPNETSGGGLSTSVMNIGSQGDGTVSVVGSGSRLDVLGASNHSLGFSGNHGTLIVSQGATANFGTAGTGGTLNLGDSSNSSSQGTVQVLTGGTLNTGHIEIAPQTSGASGIMTVDGVGSTINQTLNSANLIVGSSSGGTGTLNVNADGSFNSGTGTTTINPTGTVNVTAGAFNANGPVVIDGGTLLRASNLDGAEFNLATGQTLTASNGAQINFTRAYDLDDNTTFTIDSGADMSVDFLDLGDTGDGTLNVTGIGSTVTTPPNFGYGWGRNGNTSRVNLDNGAQGDFGVIGMANGGVPGTRSFFNVFGGATATARSISMALQEGENIDARISVNGAGSSLTLSGTLQIGNATQGFARVSVLGGLFTTGTGLTTISATGTIDVTNGSLHARGDILVDGGTLDTSFFTNSFIRDPGITLTAINGGLLRLGRYEIDQTTLRLQGGILEVNDLTISSGTFDFQFGTLDLAGSHSLDSARLTELQVSKLTGGNELRIGSTTLLDPISISGGTFATGSLTNPFYLDFQTGTFELTGDDLKIGIGGLFGDSLSVATGQTVRVSNSATVDPGSTLLVASGATFDAGTLDNNGSVFLEGPLAEVAGGVWNNGGVLRGAGIVRSDVTNVSGGEIRVELHKTLELTGSNGTNTGVINLQGGTLQFSQELTNGAAGNILGRGTLHTGGMGLTNEGDLAFSNGQTDVFGDVSNETTGQVIVSGNADVTFWDDVSHTGALFQVSSGSSATFFGAAGFGISGGGDVFFEADVTPGTSPGIEMFGGNIHFGSVANLEIEITGLTPGIEFDQLIVSGDVTLGGTLDVLLLNSFTLTPGQSFEIVDVGGVKNGFFNGLSEGAIVGAVGNVDLGISYLGGDGNDVTLLSVLPGDFDLDGDVDGRDFLVWQRNPGIGNLTDWQANYGAGSVSTPIFTQVPEPGTGMVFVGLAVCGLWRERNTRFAPRRG